MAIKEMASLNDTPSTLLSLRQSLNGVSGIGEALGSHPARSKKETDKQQTALQNQKQPSKGKESSYIKAWAPPSNAEEASKQVYMHGCEKPWCSETPGRWKLSDLSIGHY